MSIFSDLNEIIGNEKIIEFTRKLADIFIINEQIGEEGEIVEKININKPKTHSNKALSTFKSLIKNKRIKFHLKFLFLMEIVKLDLFYENLDYFNYLIELAMYYLKNQEAFFEEIIFGLNYFEIILSKIENYSLNQKLKCRKNV